MSRMNVNLAGVELKNPVMTASGTFGSGAEYSEFVDLNRLGAVVTKGVANVPWPGNPTPRVTETASGMLNAIGLQNPGIDVFCERDIPFLKKYDTKIIVNVCGKSAKDYCEVVERLGNEPVDMLEINVSCPNVKEGGIAFGQNPKALEEITKEVKKYAKQPVIMKLSPNVTDITEMAKAAEAGGADVLSLINGSFQLIIDHNTAFVFFVVEMLNNLRHSYNSCSLKAVGFLDLFERTLCSLATFHTVNRNHKTYRIYISLRFDDRKCFFNGCSCSRNILNDHYLIPILDRAAKKNSFISVVFHFLTVGTVTDILSVHFTDLHSCCYRKRDSFVCRSKQHIKIQSEFAFYRFCIILSQLAKLRTGTVKSCIYKKWCLSS